jgi:hypothetical protein
MKKLGGVVPWLGGLTGSFPHEVSDTLLKKESKNHPNNRDQRHHNQREEIHSHSCWFHGWFM